MSRIIERGRPLQLGNQFGTGRRLIPPLKDVNMLPIEHSQEESPGVNLIFYDVDGTVIDMDERRMTSANACRLQKRTESIDRARRGDRYGGIQQR